MPGFHVIPQDIALQFREHGVRQPYEADTDGMWLLEFARDVTHIGHLCTGNLESRIQNALDLEEAKPLTIRSRVPHLVIPAPSEDQSKPLYVHFGKYIKARTKVLNNELDDVFRRWYPKFRLEVPPSGAQRQAA